MRKAPKYLLILHHTTASRDRNGNCYTYTTATSTVTGQSITFTVHSPSNAALLAKRATGDEWGRCYSVESVVGSREYWHEANKITRHEGQDTLVADLARLAAGKRSNRFDG